MTAQMMAGKITNTTLAHHVHLHKRSSYLTNAARLPSLIILSSHTLRARRRILAISRHFTPALREACWSIHPPGPPC